MRITSSIPFQEEELKGAVVLIFANKQVGSVILLLFIINNVSVKLILLIGLIFLYKLRRGSPF